MSLDTASIAQHATRPAVSAPTPDTAFDSITEFVLEVTGSAMGHLSIARPIRGRRAYTSLRSPVSLPSIDTEPVLQAISEQVYRSGSPVAIPDLRAELCGEERSAEQDLWIASCLAVPVDGSSGVPAAVLTAVDTKPRRWSPDDIEKLSRLGGFVSTQIRLRAALELRDTQHQILLQEIEARRSAERELHRQASTDALTGLSNRRAFERAARYVVEQTKGPAAVVMIDLDQFKVVNDSHGHEAGDLVLTASAARIREGLEARPDLVARLGGEEFAALLPGFTQDEAACRAERCRLHLTDAPIRLGCGHSIPVTASFGVAPVMAEDTSIAVALARADRALYGAKANGRNQVASWERLRQTRQ
ncbi:MAG: sensor domain-containing diguanylate cyclase [Pseudomonadota bacterium]